MIRFACPHCDTVGQAPDQLAGAVVPCAACGRQMQVPGADTVKLPSPFELPPASPRAVPGSLTLESGVAYVEETAAQQRRRRREHNRLLWGFAAILGAVVVACVVGYFAYRGWMRSTREDRVEYHVLTRLAGQYEQLEAAAKADSPRDHYRLRLDAVRRDRAEIADRHPLWSVMSPPLSDEEYRQVEDVAKRRLSVHLLYDSLDGQKIKEARD